MHPIFNSTINNIQTIAHTSLVTVTNSVYLNHFAQQWHCFVLLKLSTCIKFFNPKSKMLLEEIIEVYRHPGEWERFFTLSSELMCIVGFDGYFQHLNPAWDILGFTQAELLQTPFIEFVHPKDQITLRTLQRQVSGTDTNAFENRCRCKDGSYKRFSWRVKASMAEQRLYAVARDLTEYKQMEETWRSQQTAQAQELENRFNDVLTTCHDLRAPVANMKMATQLLAIALERQVPRSGVMPAAQESQIARYLQILDYECDREIKLIDNLLDLERIEAGMQPLVLETIDLKPWLSEILKPFQARAANRKQTLQLDLPSVLPPLASDCSYLERILAELLNNACNYTPSGEQIALRVRVHLETIQLVISTGVEIPQRELTQIFDFCRSSGDRWQQGGTELGLMLVQKLTERLGGIVRVESASGQTCFTIEFPI